MLDLHLVRYRAARSKHERIRLSNFGSRTDAILANCSREFKSSETRTGTKQNGLLSVQKRTYAVSEFPVRDRLRGYEDQVRVFNSALKIDSNSAKASFTRAAVAG